MMGKIKIAMGLQSNSWKLLPKLKVEDLKKED